MLPEVNLQQRWQQLVSKLTDTLGKQPDMEAILLFIGIREAGQPLKLFTEKEKTDLRQMAICTLLVPAGYYQLFWVDDTGWPHYKELKRIPAMSMAQRDEFLKEYVLKYAEKNRLL
ncbi:MAG: hypothetical protein JNK27_06525 [Chitinophagaceae bacterium]|nr:hypothetical protein [Chitinophagaceae bacterium]